MRIGHFLFPWIGALLVSATIAHAADSALTRADQAAVVSSRQAALAELRLAQLATPRTTSSEVMYVHFK